MTDSLMSAMRVSAGRAWHSLSAADRDTRVPVNADNIIGCLRKQHYQFQRTKKTDPLAPRTQTRIANAMEDALAASFGLEFARHFRLSNAGSSVYVRPSHDMTVLDVPFRSRPHLSITVGSEFASVIMVRLVSHDRYDRMCQNGVLRGHLVQSSIAAVMLEHHRKIAVNSLINYYIDRDSPDSPPGGQSRVRLIQTDYDESLRERANDTIRNAAAASLNIAAAPQWFRNRDDAKRVGSPCKSCPWQRECLA